MDDLLEEAGDVKWVERRIKCTLDAIYDCLVERFKADLEDMNEALGNTKFAVTQYHPESPGIMFGLHGNQASGPTVKLSKDHLARELIVTCEDPNRSLDKFSIKPVWNEETATCGLQIDGKCWPRWRISQRSLSHLFFPKHFSLCEASQ